MCGTVIGTRATGAGIAMGMLIRFRGVEGRGEEVRGTF